MGKNATNTIFTPNRLLWRSFFVLGCLLRHKTIAVAAVTAVNKMPTEFKNTPLFFFGLFVPAQQTPGEQINLSLIHYTADLWPRLHPLHSALTRHRSMSRATFISLGLFNICTYLFHLFIIFSLVYLSFCFPTQIKLNPGNSFTIWGFCALPFYWSVLCGWSISGAELLPFGNCLSLRNHFVTLSSTSSLFKIRLPDTFVWNLLRSDQQNSLAEGRTKLVFSHTANEINPRLGPIWFPNW